MADTPADANPGLRGPTLAELQAAVDKLKANNIPPCVCPKCGGKFYVFNPDLERLEGSGLVLLCNDCDPPAASSRP